MVELNPTLSKTAQSYSSSTGYASIKFLIMKFNLLIYIVKTLVSNNWLFCLVICSSQ